MDRWESTPRIAILSTRTRPRQETRTENQRPTRAPPRRNSQRSARYLFRKVGHPEGRPHDPVRRDRHRLRPEKPRHEESAACSTPGTAQRRAGRCVARATRIVDRGVPAYAAVALAGLGEPTDTILPRSIVIAMRRRSGTEEVSSPGKPAVTEPERLAGRTPARDPPLSPLATPMARMPDQVQDRPADVWEPLLAVADQSSRTSAKPGTCGDCNSL